MKNISKILFMLQFVLCGLIIPQNEDKPLVGNGKISFYLDQTSFLGKENKTYQEFSLMVYADQLKLFVKDGKQTSILKVKSKITDLNEATISEKGWTTEASFENVDDVRTLVVYDRWGELLAPGEYKIFISLKDQDGFKEGILNSVITIPSMAIDKIGISKIQFINGVQSDSRNLNTEKKSVVPNPSRRFGLLNPAINFYFEIYRDETAGPVKLSALYTIKDTRGKIFKEISNVELNTDRSTEGYTQAIDVSKLQSGIYNLEIIVSDSSSSFVRSTNRNFEIIQADYLAKTLFVTKEESEIAERILSYIATPFQLKLYKELSGPGKANFLIQFFRDVDPTPQTKENEYLQNLIKRYHYSNQNFGWNKSEGWSTEKGRIFIQNGKPDEIERHEFDSDSRPYEIWFYRKDREIFYLFADLQGNGKYILINSNKEGEVFNNSWRELINRL